MQSTGVWSIAYIYNSYLFYCHCCGSTKQIAVFSPIEFLVCNVGLIMKYCTQENFGIQKIWWIRSYLPKFSLPIFTKYIFEISTDCSSFAKIFLTNSFYLYSLLRFFPTNIFPCMVIMLTILALFYSVILLHYAPISMHCSQNHSQDHCQNTPGALKVILYCKAWLFY